MGNKIAVVSYKVSIVRYKIPIVRYEIANMEKKLHFWDT